MPEYNSLTSSRCRTRLLLRSLERTGSNGATREHVWRTRATREPWRIMSRDALDHSRHADAQLQLLVIASLDARGGRNFVVIVLHTER